ncbi:hypothetical protein [Sphingomonas crusticola]|uniref:hypothetical protein n=1 Tax=Sphingomonas crusticola TaxID=1697973 RepID=UPI000E288B56|nr:hypothetical protein [Sphingomonas crusticola]
MPLLSLYDSAADSVDMLNIEQVVSTAGDGILKDDSVCALEIREYFSKISTEKIALYIDHCLSVSFNRSGLVLQDLVNELGRRLDYRVTNGRYQGVQGQVGFDGLWLSPEQHTLIVEVKTTDAYRISLDALSNYRSKLSEQSKITSQSSILIIVGRQDTGELEAQIRGSRHAWDIRVISAEALIKLVLLKENTESDETGLKMRSLLTPIEYTRLDRMVDVMFTTAVDLEDDSELSHQAVEGASTTDLPSASAPSVLKQKIAAKSAWEFTDSQLLQAKREDMVKALARFESTNLIRKSRALYWNTEHSVRAACTVSKRYTGKNQAPYWYAYHPQWDAFLGEVDKGYFVLGCMDRSTAFAIPHKTISKLLPLLNTTDKNPRGTYWHIHLVEQASGLAIAVPKGEPISLKPFEIVLARFDGTQKHVNAPAES